jgi:hypothetical protein
MEVEGHGTLEPLPVQVHGIEFCNASCTFGEWNTMTIWAGVHEFKATVAGRWLGRATRAVAGVSLSLY